MADRPQRRPSAARMIAFALLTLLCLATALTYVALAARRDRDPGPATTAGLAARVEATVASGSFLAVQHVRRGPGYARLALVPHDRPRASRILTSLVCERLHVAATGGLCLLPERRLINPRPIAKILGPDLRVRGRVRLAGVISRARVSRDGRYGAATTFVFGHSYVDDAFSTQTTLIDMARGKTIGDLEDFAITRDGGPLRRRDFNFWGVTFAADSNRFYATLRTGGRTYLVHGDVSRRRAYVVREGVECPSLSPDGKRIAYKRRTQGGWRLHVIDLATLVDRPLAETRSVDDQVEWLDGRRVLYGLQGSVWTVPAAGGGEPVLFLRDALSPAVVRGGL